MVKTMQYVGLVWMAYLGVSGAMASENYPQKPIRLVVGHTAGGVDDVWARRYAKELEERLKQPVLVENRPGASGTLAAMEVQRSPNDGYTVLFGGLASLVQYPSAGGQVRYKPKEDFVPVAIGVMGYPVLASGAGSWAKSMQDVLSRGKSQSLDTYACATSGQASTAHFGCALIANASGLKLRMVPYKSGSAAATDAAAGHVDFSVGFYGEISPLTSGNRLIPLMVLGPKRLPLYPQTPTAQEVGMGQLSLPSFSAFYVPKGTPQAIIDKLNSAAIASFHVPHMERWLADAGAFYQAMTPAEIRRFYFAEIDKWTRISQEHQIKVEQ